ncbi:MAG: NUDIX hydrolase [Clostridia bacterium]|nr:NUDIX hydrolase [Clostridia bacterium]
MTELWDAYDKDMNKVDRAKLVRGEPIPDGLYHLVCDVAVSHSDGSWLLMRRHPAKPFGDRWEFSAGGSALSGETALEAAKRELFEETGIENAALSELGRIIHHSGHSIYVEFIAETDCDKRSITVQDGETVGFKWVSTEELVSLPQKELATVRIQPMIDELREY